MAEIRAHQLSVGLQRETRYINYPSVALAVLENDEALEAKVAQLNNNGRVSFRIKVGITPKEAAR